MAVVSVFVSFFLAGDAFAQDETSRARRLYQSATTHYNLREYDQALIDFKETYRLRPDAALLFNIAQCYRQLGDSSQASSYYRAYRREAPDAPNRTEVDRLITEMENAAKDGRPSKTDSDSVSGAATNSTARPASPATSAPDTSESVAKSPPPLIGVTTTPQSRHRRIWIWPTVAGAVVLVAGAVTLAVIFGRSGDPSPSLGRVEGP